MQHGRSQTGVLLGQGAPEVGRTPGHRGGAKVKTFPLFVLGLFVDVLDETFPAWGL